MQIATTRPQTLRRKPQWGTLLPALAAGFAAAGFAFLLVRSRLPMNAAAPPLAAVVVAACEIPARTKITGAMLHLRMVLPGDLPAGAARASAGVVGKIAVLPIPAGAAVTLTAITAPSAALGLAFALPPTLRAVTVATDPADGVDLFVRPEDHVDILATNEPGSGPMEARTVLQNVLLLAVGTQTSPDPPPASSAVPAGSASHVTVAVTAAQAQALVLAAARGHLHLALRAIGDGSEAALPRLPAPVLQTHHAQSPPHFAAARTPAKARPLPPMPVSLMPIPALPPHVTMTVIKGSFSQTVSVAP